VLEFDEQLSRGLYRADRLAPEFPASAVEEPRPNGGYGLSADFDAARWRLNVPGLRLTLDEVKSLPRAAMTTELKCIEGWSVVVQWAGTRLRDFMARYRLGTRSGDAPDPEGRPGDLFDYVSLETPDGEYYVGLDMASALHPQTLLCYEMNGEPLAPIHGAPLRLVIPVKYGIKNLKRIGSIRFTDARPADYWAERGYDWYAGH
jgi:DMSO/TMAO reductase YedYZ molybdopterin-dependent catalytic subunit